MDDKALIFPFSEVAQIDKIGGKGRGLAKLVEAGFLVPEGFCLSTEAFDLFISQLDDVEKFYQQLSVATASRKRQELKELPFPALVKQSIVTYLPQFLKQIGRDCLPSMAIRSSATAEDLPHLSFAGQQESYLNVQGVDAIVEAIKSCWISLFTDRAMHYRDQNGFDHRRVALAVVLQRMINPEKSGILFTADPMTHSRSVMAIDAGFGLGEGLVSGIVSADLIRVNKRTLQIIERQTANKEIAVRFSSDTSGTVTQYLNDDEGLRPVLNDRDVTRLGRLGCAIEVSLGFPQDIEWCYAADTFYIVQSRPITTLYPIETLHSHNGKLAIYMSFNHLQVMTDPLPLAACNLWQILLPFGKEAGREMDVNPNIRVAGNRLYIDVTALLKLPTRNLFFKVLGHVDTIIAHTLDDVVTDFGIAIDRNIGRSLAPLQWLKFFILKMPMYLFWTPPNLARTRILNAAERQVFAAIDVIDAGTDIRSSLLAGRKLCGSLFRSAFIPIPPLVLSAIVARKLLKKMLMQYVDAVHFQNLERGLMGNVTTELDLKVGDLGDCARAIPSVTAWLKTGKNFTLDHLKRLTGSGLFLIEIESFLATYGIRGPGEIDLSRKKWAEDPASLFHVIAGHLEHPLPGSHRRHYERLTAQFEVSAKIIIGAAKHGVFGVLRQRLVRHLIDVIRTLAPLREHPKWYLLNLLSAMKRRIQEAGVVLMQAHRLDRADDVWHLEVTEIEHALEHQNMNIRALVDLRKHAFIQAQTMHPPRVITSDGDMPTWTPKQTLSNPNTLQGSAVSNGEYEGLARVMLDPSSETLKPGEILVTRFTDPGWTPLFINAAALVMEVGGMMTHGSVIAREYGIPAVVCVPNATTAIRSGDRLRVDGGRGTVEIVRENAPN